VGGDYRQEESSTAFFRFISQAGVDMESMSAGGKPSILFWNGRMKNEQHPAALAASRMVNGSLRRWTLLFSALTVAGNLGLGPPAYGAAPRPLRIAYLSNSVTMASLWMAKETGAIAREGLDTEILSMTASVAIPALIANELDAVQVSGAPVLTASLRGHDVVFVAGLLNTMIWNFYSRPEIRSVEALRGKIVGTDRPATPIAYGTLVSLKKIGLTPKDVQLFPVGSSTYVIAALQAGQVMAGVASPPANFQLERLGFHQLTSLLDVPYQNVGIVIRRSRFDELKGRLIPLLRALRTGIDRYYSDKSFTIKVISKYNKETDPDALDKSYEFYRRAGFRRELVVSESGIQGILDFLSESIPEAKKAKPSQFFDDRLVKQVDGAK
jgi:ABC-type nitrate/sulfonate/bicarbonate transport system substrate-binding protein